MTISKSFQDLHDELYKEGIKDVGFLTYTNPSVKGLDPYSEDLTRDEKLLIVKEVQSNFWYFLRELARIGDMSLGKIQHYKINRGSLGSLWLATKNHNVYSVLPWRCSNISSQSLWCLWKLTTQPNYRCKLLDVSPESALMFMDRVKTFNSLLPDYIRVCDDYIDHSVQIVKNPKTMQEADILARGMTVDIFIVNLEDIPFIDIIMKNILPVLSCGASKLYATGFIGEKGTHGKTTGDKISSSSKKWFVEMLDIDVQDKTSLIYNETPAYLVHNDEVLYELKKDFGYDAKLMDRYVHLKR